MFFDVMDWDLWGPTYNQVDSSYGTQPGGQFDYYFGYGPDVLEETALNEKYCVQVLRIKNTKADAEIDQLEEDLLVLQSQLVWTEDEEWTENCFAALREKIDCLNSAILSLKNEEENDVNAYLTMHREPAEKIHEIMKVLLKNYLEKDGQPWDIIVRESSSDTQGHATNLMDEGKQFSKFDSNIAVKQEIEEPNFAPSEKCTAPNSPLKPVGKITDSLKGVKIVDIIVQSTKVDASENMADHSNGKKKSHVSELNIAREQVSEHRSTATAKDMNLDPSLEPEEKKTDHRGIIKPLDVIVKETSSYLGLTTDLLDERKKISDIDPNRAIKEEIREPTVALSEKCTAPNSSLKPEGKQKDFLIEVETLEIIAGSSNVDTSKNVAGHPNRKESHHSVLKITTEEVNKHQSIPLAKDTVLDLSLEPGEKNTDLRGKVKPPYTTIKASSLDTSKPAIVCSDGSRSLSEPVSKVHGMEEVNELKSTTTGRCISLNSFPAGKGTNIPKTNKRVDASVKTFSTDSLRHATGLHSNNGKKHLSNSGSSLNAMVPTKRGDSSVKPIKSNSTSENRRNECFKESMGALSGKNDSSNSLLKMDEKTSPLVTRKVQDGVITDIENIAVVSNLDLQVQHEKDTTQQKLEKGRKIRPCEGQKVEIDANDKSIMECPLKLQRLKEPKRKFLPKSLSVQEGSVPMEVKSDASSISKGKKRRKSGINDDVTLVEIMKESKLKKIVDSVRCEAQVFGVAPSVSKKTVPWSQKKRKKCLYSPIIAGIKYPTFQKDLHRDKSDAASEEDNIITNSRSTGISDKEAVPSLPPSLYDYLNALSMVDLKAIAKQHKLTGYSGLRKAVLIQQIVTQLQ